MKSTIIFLMIIWGFFGGMAMPETPCQSPSPTQTPLDRRSFQELLAEAQRNFDEARQFYEYGTFEYLHKAENKFQVAKELFNQIGENKAEALALLYLGRIARSFEKITLAVKYYDEALILFRKTNDKQEEAIVLNNLGFLYFGLDNKVQALTHFEAALAIATENWLRATEAESRNNIGAVYDSIGDKVKALANYEAALNVFKAIGRNQEIAKTYNNIGAVYDSLGETQKALDYYLLARPILQDSGEKQAKATNLSNIGLLYISINKSNLALPFLNQALVLFRDIPDEKGEAKTLGVLGGVNLNLGDLKNAQKNFEQSLEISRKIGDKTSEASALHNIGSVYEILDDSRKAVEYYEKSLILKITLGDRIGEANSLNSIGYSGASLKNSKFAIFCRKEAVNVYQETRNKYRSLDNETQKTYLKSIDESYRGLADLLIVQERLPETQQVIAYFRDQQFFDFENDSNNQISFLGFSLRESHFATQYKQASENLRKIASQIVDLKQQATSNSNPQLALQLQKLETELQTKTDDILAVLKKAETDFSGPPTEKDKVGEVADTKEMQTALRNLQSRTGQKAVAIYTLEANENYRGLLITPDKIVAVSYPIKAAELRQRAVTFFGQLSEVDKQTNAPKSSTSEVQKMGKELYDIVFAPIDKKLKELNLKPDVLMWSLDGALRYLPVASLYDGKRYLAERYRNVVFTRANAERMLSPVSPTWTGSGFYNSKEYSLPVRSSDGKMKLVGFDGLKNAKTEIETIFGTKQKQGIITGDFFPDDKFTKESFFKALKLNRPLVHIASHFKFEPGDASSSFLLLGDENMLTLDDIKNTPDDLLKGVELLTLSACETGVQKERGSDGREIDSFAELAQRKGARAILASLWKVNDESTSLLMTQFYQTRQTNKLTKVEALQKAQLRLLRSKNFSHPYFWAPFILLGNWR